MTADGLQFSLSVGTPRLPAARHLVAAKLAPPAIRDGFVARPRLLEALDAAAQARLVLVSAPTGYGKTTLVAAWAAGRAPLAWLSLAATENDPALLMRYLIGALRSAGADVGHDAEVMLQVPGASPAAWMASLANDLDAFAGRLTLVLDEYETVTAPDCHAMVRSMLDRESITVVVTTQVDPPLDLGTLRAAGQLAELRGAELAFTAAEAGQTLVEREGLPIDAATVAALTERTEGWPAGLYLAALWLRRSPAQTVDVERFAGDHRHIVDYLREAVLERSEPDVRDFLLRTSIVERLSPSLCDALLERPTARTLEAIEQRNLFLVALDETRSVYRYHHLFREMLRGELVRREPGRVAPLHARASAWFRDAGMVPEAIEHATAAGDLEGAAELICRHWLEWGFTGQTATVMRWIEAFGPVQTLRYPEFGVIGGLIVGITGGSRAAFDPWLRLARQQAPDDRELLPLAGTSSVDAGRGLLQSVFAYRDIGVAIVHAQRTVELDPGRQGWFRVPALTNLGFLTYLAGDLDQARAALGAVRRDPLASQQPYGYLGALGISALIALDEGAAPAGERLARQALAYAASVGLADNQVAALGHVALGRCLLHAHRIDSAHEQLLRGVMLLRGTMMPAWHAYALLCAAPVVHQLGDAHEARELVDEAEELLARFEDAGTLPAFAADVRRRLSLAQRRRAAGEGDALSDAELRVLLRLRGPGSQRDIASDLSISLNTVKTHCSVIYRKLGVTTRDQAVARGVELGVC